MFTRNEFYILLFLLGFGFAGAVLQRTIRPVQTGELKVESSAFPVRGESVPDTAKPAECKKTLKTECVKININRADISDLMQLKGIGKAMAGRILECRSRLGGFKTKEDLLQVKGIGRKRLETIEPWIEI